MFYRICNIKEKYGNGEENRIGWYLEKWSDSTIYHSILSILIIQLKFEHDNIFLTNTLKLPLELFKIKKKRIPRESSKPLILLWCRWTL